MRGKGRETVTNQPPSRDRATDPEDLEPGTASAQQDRLRHPEQAPGDQRAAETLVIEPRAARLRPSTNLQEPEPMTDDSQRPVILSPPDGTTLSSRGVTFAGTGMPSSHILVRDWLRPIVQCETDEEGRWSATIGDLPSGTHVFVAEWVDPDGALLATSAAWTIRVPSQKELDAIAARQKQSGRRGIRRLLRRKSVPSEAEVPPEAAQPEAAPPDEPPPAVRLEEEHDTPAPDQPDPGPPTPPDPGVPHIMHPEDGRHVGQTLTLFGTSAAGSTIAILDDADLVGLTESDDTGYWTATVKSLTPGIHQMHARSTADGSEWRLVSAPVRIVVRERVSPGDVDHT